RFAVGSPGAGGPRAPTSAAHDGPRRRQFPDTVPEANMLRAWRDTWQGIGDITVGMARRTTTSSSPDTMTRAGARRSSPPSRRIRLGVGADAMEGGPARGAGDTRGQP